MARLIVRDLAADNVPHWAASIAYYGLLSLFPLLLAAASLAAHFVDADWAIRKGTEHLVEFVPQGGELVRSTVLGAIEAAGSTGLLSLLVLLWSGSRVFGALRRALNVVCDVEEPSGFWIRLGVELAMTLSFGALFLVSLGTGLLLDIASSVLRTIPRQRDMVVPLLAQAAPTALLLTSFFLTYRFVPRCRMAGRAALVGAAAATLLLLLARVLFLFYLQQFARFNLIYGSLAIVIALLVWAWLAAFITLLGGELASHFQMLAIEGQSLDQVADRHRRRSGDRAVEPPGRTEGGAPPARAAAEKDAGDPA